MHYLLIGYMFLFIDRPFEVWPILGDIHLERLYMAVTLTVWAAHPAKRWVPDRQHFAMLAFIGALVFCWMLSPWGDAGWHTVEDYLKIAIFAALLITTVHDERALKLMVAGFLVVMGLYMLHSFKEYVAGRVHFRMGINRLVGVDKTMGNPNAFGATVLYSLPFVTALWPQFRARGRLLLLGYCGLATLCILLTGSRSSLVGLIAFGLVTALMSRGAWKYLILGAACSPGIFLALPDSLQNRFETIIDPSVGPESAKVSGEGRIEGLLNGLELLSRYPLSGCGPGAWRPATGSEIESHNLYGQVMGEMGLLGILTFGWMVVAFVQNLMRAGRARKRARASPGELPFAVSRAVGVWLFLMLLEGNFGHSLFRYNWLWYGGFLTAAGVCIRSRRPARVGVRPRAVQAIVVGRTPRIWRPAEAVPSR